MQKDIWAVERKRQGEVVELWESWRYLKDLEEMLAKLDCKQD